VAFHMRWRLKRVQWSSIPSRSQHSFTIYFRFEVGQSWMLAWASASVLTAAADAGSSKPLDSVPGSPGKRKPRRMSGIKRDLLAGGSVKDLLGRALRTPRQMRRKIAAEIKGHGQGFAVPSDYDYNVHTCHAYRDTSPAAVHVGKCARLAVTTASPSQLCLRRAHPSPAWQQRLHPRLWPPSHPAHRASGAPAARDHSPPHWCAASERKASPLPPLPSLTLFPRRAFPGTPTFATSWIPPTTASTRPNGAPALVTSHS
jgi:hypothetical protein